MRIEFHFLSGVEVVVFISAFSLFYPLSLFSVPGVTNPFGMGYLFNPYAAYANGAAQLVSTDTSLSFLHYILYVNIIIVRQSRGM